MRDQNGVEPHARGAARRRRASRIRAATVTFAVTGFCAVWSVVYAQMAAGNDPALGASKATTVTDVKRTASSASSETPAVTGSDTADTDSTSSERTDTDSTSSDSTSSASTSSDSTTDSPVAATSSQS